ncbi:MAG: hypothetical protein JOS17DRAFT_795445 [Linnemannia elongata]|nr:MAG: hypothetical protein JOS17DRAFT_795445 [Linnemannia elongata]
MTNNLFTLFCLVDGEKTAFPVEIESTKTVSDLKKVIRIENRAQEGSVEISLADVSLKEELVGTDDIADAFGASITKKTIHIIVQQPPPLQKTVSAGNSTQLFAHAQDSSRSFCSNDFILELAVILNGVNYHRVTHPFDPKDVEASQRERQGRFYKRALPYHEIATDIYLAMLGSVLDRQARTSNVATLRSLVEDDIGKNIQPSFQASRYPY